MQSDVLIYETVDTVCTITLHRPQALNAFNENLRRDLRIAVEKASQDDTIRVIVLKGSGKGFCAGADLAEGVEDGVERQLKEQYKPAILAIRNAPKPVIAQIHGPAAGIGAGFALACDMVVMAQDAYMYLAFAAIGLIPDGGLNWQLYHALGPRKAFEIIAQGKKMSAAECLSYGFCNDVVPVDQLDETVNTLAGNLAKGAPLAQAAVKKMLNQAGRLSLSDAIDLEAEIQQPLSQSEDCRGAINAFFEKQTFSFRGR